MKPFLQSERRRGVDASRRIRLVLKCFHGRRSRVGFNGRLRGFWWIISGGAVKKRRRASSSPPPPPWRSVVTACMRLSVRKAATKRVGYTITRWDMRGIPTIRPPIGRLRTISGSPLDFRTGTRCDRVPDTRLAARKRQDPEGDSLEGLSTEWSPPTSRGERRQMRTRYTMYRTATE